MRSSVFQFFFTIFLVLPTIVFAATITTAGSGMWSSTSTWIGGVLPTATDDIVVGVGHIVTVDEANAVCNSISFGDATAHLAMGSASSVLSVYGNITLALFPGSGATATAVTDGSTITSIDVTAGGSGYIAVVVAFSGGGGSGLSATANLTGGVITSITVNNGGTGYTTAPTVSIFPTHTIFTAWPAGAKIKFSGSAAAQTLSGWSPSAFSTSFDEIIIDKSSGKVTTGATNMRFGIGTSLEVIAGTFELGSTDDIEGRTYAGTASSPIVTIQSGAVFNMVGGASHIRRASNTGDETSKIGKMTVFGTVSIAAGSTNKINFGGIDIENGGLVEFPTGRSTVSNSFNPGIINVKGGGTFKNSLSTTAFWYNNITSPPIVIVNSGGEYEAAATSTTIPQGGITQNSGSSFRFSSGSATTLPAGITSYKTLILSGAGSKTLSVNTTIDEALQLSGSFTTLSLSTYTLAYNASAVLRYGASGQTTAQITKDAEWPVSNGPQHIQIYNSGGVTLHDNRTVPGTFTLTLGTFDNNGSANDKVLTFADGATISRARGALSSIPTFGTTINLAYTSSVEKVTTGYEMPASSSVLNNLSVTSSQGITLGANGTVNGTLTFDGSAGLITTNAFTLSLASTASITGEAVGRYVVGNLATAQTVGTAASTMVGIGVSIASGTDDLGNVTVTRVSGANGVVTSNSKAGIARKWSITSNNPPANGRELTLSWVSSDDSGKVFSMGNKARAYRYIGTEWKPVGSWVDVSGSDPRTLTVNTTSFSDWTVSDETSPLSIPASISLLPKEINFGSVQIDRSKDSVVTINNPGDDTLKIASVTSTDPSFSSIVNSKDIPPGGTLIDTIRFTPFEGGARQGKIVFVSNAKSMSDTISVNGFGLTYAFTISSENVHLGMVQVGGSKDTLITITNSGSDTVTISSISSDNPAFTVHPSMLIIPAGATAVDSIRFSPTVPGSVTGNVILISNASTSPDTIAVSGFGATYGANYSTKTINMGRVLIGQKKDTTLLITNTGNQPLNIGKTESTSPVFIVVAAPSVIASGATETDTIRFSPSTDGQITAKIIITHNAGAPDTIEVTGNGVLTGVQGDRLVPTEYSMHQNYPNPFNPTTIISYEIPTSSFVTLTVFDVLGRKLTSLVHEQKEAGFYDVHWNAGKISSGLYFYQIQAGNFVSVKKMMLMK